MIETESSSESLKTAVLKLASSLLQSSSELAVEQDAEVLESVFTSKSFSVVGVCEFCRNLKQWSKFVDDVRPKLVSFFEEKLVNRGLSALERQEVLHMLAELVSDNISFEEGYTPVVLEEEVAFSFSKMAAKSGESWWNVLFEVECSMFSESEVEITWASLVALPLVR